MGIKLVKGNIVTALIKKDIDIFAHGVNCMGGFGSGLAGEITRRLPIVREAYIEKHKGEGWQLGQTQLVEWAGAIDDTGNILTKFAVMNCATQYNYGREPRKQPDGMYCNYAAIRDCMNEYHETCQIREWLPGVPFIGCGLAGGDWDRVEEIIEDVFNDMTIAVYYLK